MFVYFYDVKPKTKLGYVKLKRAFYYHLNRIRLKDFSYRTKSVLVVDDKYEKLLDGFFIGFKGDVEVYKIKTDDITQIC